MMTNDSHNTVIIEIDSKSGFCFGVARAVKMAEEQLAQNKQIVSLGDIVHNNEEIARLEKGGMLSSDHEHIQALKNKTVLFRAHGEPPASYETLKNQGAEIIDATCPVVIKLQNRVRTAWVEMKKVNGQVAIYGKKGHPEVTGLVGQTSGEAIVINSLSDLTLLDPTRPLALFSQTTMSYKGLEEIQNAIAQKFKNNTNFKFHNTICAQVGNRAPHLRIFAAKFDVIIFVGGEKSSNAKVLFEACKEVNSSSFFTPSAALLQVDWFPAQIKSIGICGATSTPMWLMEDVAQKIKQLIDGR
jgi:4-hydroxy-3-methylbut-2-enyl diphosphate reductase